MKKTLRTFKTFGIGNAQDGELDERLRAIFRSIYSGQGLPQMVVVGRSRAETIKAALGRLDLGAVGIETLGGILSTELWVVTPA